MPVVNYDWDELEDNIVEEYDDAGNTLATYTTEPELHGNLISQNRGGVESQYHFDAQGSTLALTDDNQQVTDTYAYTAFGERTERTGTTESPFQYIGQKQYYKDEATGDVSVRARPYRPRIGRWLSIDTMNRFAPYVYGTNCAINQIDPSGLECLDKTAPYDPGFKEVWDALILGDKCTDAPSIEEGKFILQIRFWSWDSAKKECDPRSGKFYDDHLNKIYKWIYENGSGCHLPPEVAYRASHTPPPGSEVKPYYKCKSVRFTFHCPVICSRPTCRPLVPEGELCIGTTVSRAAGFARDGEFVGQWCALVKWKISYPEGNGCDMCPPCRPGDAHVSIEKFDWIFGRIT